MLSSAYVHLAKLAAHRLGGARQVIEELRARGYLIGVVTSKGRDLANRGLKLCSLDGLIDAAIFLEDTQIHKPQPEPILAALAKLKARADCAAMGGPGTAVGPRHPRLLWRLLTTRALTVDTTRQPQRRDDHE